MRRRRSDPFGLGLGWAAGSFAGGGAPVIVTDGLLGEWRFDDGSGATLTDYSGNDNHGTLGDGAGNNDPAWTAEGLDFAGETDDHYVTLPSMAGVKSIDIVFSNDDTITTVLTAQYLLGHIVNCGVILGSATGTIADELICLNQDSTDGYSGNHRRAYTQNGGTIATGWHCLQIAKRAATEYFNIVLDGTEVDNATALTPEDWLTGVWSIGSRAGASVGVNSYDGKMAYLIFYTTALTNGQQAQNRAALTAILADRGIALP